MKVKFSSAFIKASKKLSGKMLESLKRTIVEVKVADDIQSITDCKKLVGYHTIYTQVSDLDFKPFEHTL